MKSSTTTTTTTQRTTEITTTANLKSDKENVNEVLSQPVSRVPSQCVAENTKIPCVLPFKVWSTW